jgi:nucleotide-binding universal stress UspA family protein
LYRIKEKFSRILVALDGSEPSMDAVDYAIYIAQKNGADLTALYVVSSPPQGDYTSDMPEDQIPETVKEVVQNSNQGSQPRFNKVSEKVAAAAAAIVKEDTKKTTSTIQLKTEEYTATPSFITPKEGNKNFTTTIFGDYRANGQ